MSPATFRPIMRYPGGKARIAEWVVAHLPPHDIYVEPFCGAASVLFAKERCQVEVINDLDERVVNLFRVIREQPEQLARAVAMTPYSRREYEISDAEIPADSDVEAARRFLVRVWMAHAGRMGGKPGWRCGLAGSVTTHRGAISKVWTGVPDRILAVVDRLKDVMIECRPALQIIDAWRRPEALLYCDPPYVWATRERRGIGENGHYAHEMTDQDHEQLLDALVAHPGPVVLSGYRSPAYDERLVGWRRADLSTLAYRNSKRVESLWLNPVAAATARQPALFAEVRS